MVISEDIPTARQVFRMESYNLSKDLGLNDYEGILSYPVPLDKDTDFTGGPREYDALKVLKSNQPDLIGKFVRMTHGWHGQLLARGNIGEEMHYNTGSVYRDGILVPHVTIRVPSHVEHYITNHLTCLIVNIPKSKSKDISLARNQIITDSSEWAGPIFNAHLEMLKRKYSSNDLEPSHPQRYLFRLASFMLFHGLSSEQLSKLLDNNCLCCVIEHKKTGPRAGFSILFNLEDQS